MSRRGQLSTVPQKQVKGTLTKAFETIHPMDQVQILSRVRPNYSVKNAVIEGKGIAKSVSVTGVALKGMNGDGEVPENKKWRVRNVHAHLSTGTYTLNK